MTTNDLSPDAWNERYKSGNTPWDLSTPTPEFVRLLDEKLLPLRGRVLVPGGGRGHDAILFSLRGGYEVDLVDFAPDAVRAALEEASKQRAVVHAYCRNFFELPLTAFHQSAYDILLEYTFFCAIDPSLRKDYVNAAAALLRPGGVLVGLFFPLESDKPPPPYLVNEAEIRSLFGEKFHVQLERPQKSVKARANRELLGIFRRK